MDHNSIKSCTAGRWMRTTRGAGFLLIFVVAAACVVVDRAPSKTSTGQGTTATVESASAPPTPPPAGHAAKASTETPAEPTQKKKSTVANPGKQATPSLDLASLEKRLRQTDAIGTYTKIILKNQIDDLLDQFRAYYQGRAKTTLAELRQPYDRLLLKVLSLLQDSDPVLARTILASREAIWGILADPAKFAAI